MRERQTRPENRTVDAVMRAGYLQGLHDGWEGAEKVILKCIKQELLNPDAGPDGKIEFQRVADRAYARLVRAAGAPSPQKTGAKKTRKEAANG